MKSRGEKKEEEKSALLFPGIVSLWHESCMAAKTSAKTNVKHFQIFDFAREKSPDLHLTISASRARAKLNAPLIDG